MEIKKQLNVEQYWTTGKIHHMLTTPPLLLRTLHTTTMAESIVSKQ